MYVQNAQTKYENNICQKCSQRMIRKESAQGRVERYIQSTDSNLCTAHVECLPIRIEF